MRVWPAFASLRNSASVTTLSVLRGQLRENYCETTCGLSGASDARGERRSVRRRARWARTISRRHALAHVLQLLAHRADRRGVILRAENRRAGDEGVGAGARRLGDVVGLDAAVDLEPDLPAERIDAPPNLRDLGKHRAQELLAAEPRVHRHQEHDVELLERMVEK